MRSLSEREDALHEWPFTERTEWAQWLSPRNFSHLPVHRWYVFPHSFSPEFVPALAREWNLGGSDHLLDPFLGSGTTVLSAQGLGIPSSGYDLSPLADFVSQAKCARPSGRDVEQAYDDILAEGPLPDVCSGRNGTSDPLLGRAFNAVRLAKLLGLADRIRRNVAEESCRSFLMLALLRILPRFALAERNGGWLRWRTDASPASEVESAFADCVQEMLGDLVDGESPCVDATIAVADARALPDADDSVTAVITSPPYPNRHDYTRIFALELLLLFLDAEAVLDLRRQSFESHPEARPRRPEHEQYNAPISLQKLLGALRSARVRRMLDGYFVDLYLSLREMARVLRPGCPAALVVGNAQYEGQALLVDELTAEIGEAAGLACTEIRVLRLRGNSAQQMGRFGRRPSRESLVMFRTGRIGARSIER